CNGLLDIQSGGTVRPTRREIRRCEAGRVDRAIRRQVAGRLESQRGKGQFYRGRRLYRRARQSAEPPVLYGRDGTIQEFRAGGGRENRAHGKLGNLLSHAISGEGLAQ